MAGRADRPRADRLGILGQHLLQEDVRPPAAGAVGAVAGSRGHGLASSGCHSPPSSSPHATANSSRLRVAPMTIMTMPPTHSA